MTSEFQTVWPEVAEIAPGTCDYPQVRLTPGADAIPFGLAKSLSLHLNVAKNSSSNSRAYDRRVPIPAHVGQTRTSTRATTSHLKSKLPLSAIGERAASLGTATARHSLPVYLLRYRN